ncbi:MAG TPA: GEVED domain-containing protein [Bacteroidales bacterium]|nr:GEVED domain-containing protein [Bacteroidales bacterium]
MKKLLFLLMLLLATTLSNAQTTIFFEDFDPPSGADLVTPSGASNFAINTRLHYSGTQCDSLKAPLNGISYLTTQSFSTMGSTNVMLKFAHICKVEIFDTAKVEISVNGGAWIKLTTQYVNPGNSQFLNQTYRFCAATYPVDWWATNDTIKPQQSWWKYETFDISALAANSSNVRVRFTLRGNVSNDVCSGWYLDDILVIGGTSELLPPKITMKTPIIQDTVYNTGPFNIFAYIRDASGIDTAYIVYQLNNGANQYVPMTWVSDSTYTGTIPSYTYNNRIDYHIYAADNSSTHNFANGPNQWFYIKHGPNTVQIGTGTSTQTYPFYMNWGYTRSASIYQSSEINANGQILSLEWYVSTAAATNCPIKIYLKTTTSSTFASGSTWASLISGATLVYDNTNSFSTVGWKLITLTTPFNYTSGNLMVLCEANYGGTGISTYPSFQYTSTTPNYTHQYLYADNTPPTGTATTSYNRPNIKISFPPNNNTQDAGVSQIVAPTGVILAGVNSPVTISIKNYAIDSLKKATIAWKLDGVLQTPSYTWNGVLLQDMISSNFSIGNVNVAPGAHTIKVWTELPNDSTDQNNTNDTITASFYACTSILNGPYTIGPSGADFPTFTAALAAMLNCGISGPVTFNVQSGIYTEQLTIPEIPGTSATNTITFQSLTGVNTDVTLRYTTDATNNFVVKLNGADHFRFKNMTLLSTATTAYCRVIEMTGNAVDNQFEGNNITGIVATALSTNTALVYSASGTTSLDSLAVFNNNTFTNGSYGVYLYGASTSVLENKTTITNNTFNNQYGRAIHLYYQSASTIRGNIINGHATNTSYYGIYAGYCDNDLKILKNKIIVPVGTYGIYLYYCDGTTIKKGLIANNFVQIGGTIATYGIYASYSTFQEFYFNSVNITSTNTTASAFYIASGCAPIVLKNNILANNGGGYSIYSALTTGVTSDYNDLYTTGTTLGYWSAATSNLAAWQTASSQDANSVSVNPQFVSTTNLHTFSPAVNSHATPITGITDDIDGDARDASTPDIGADELAPFADDLGIMSVIAPLPVSCGLGANESITIRIKNYGLNTITTADVYYKLNNGTPVQGVFSGSLAADSSINFTFPSTVNLSAIGAYNFKFYVAMAGDMFLMNDTLSNYSVANGWDFYTSEYNMGFEPANDMSSWSIVNSDLGAYKWVMPYTSGTYAHSGTNSAQFLNNTTNTGEDWLFSRCFNLEAGKTYSLSFWYRADIATTPQTITLKYGNAPTSAAMTTTITTLTGFTNIVYQKSTSQFTAPANGVYYFGWSGTVGVTNNAYIDDINLKLLPNQEAAVVSMSSPVEGCGLGNETVTMQIYNPGGQLINGNLTAYYKILGGGSTVTQAVTQQIPVGDTIDFTFTTPANLYTSNVDSTFSIKAWVVLTGDPIQVNDTIIYDVLSKFVPSDPIVVSDTVGFGGIATLSASSTGPLYWYSVPTGGSPIGTGPTFTTPNLNVTTPYYVQASSGMAGDSLSTIFTGGNGCNNGNMFDLQPLSTSLTITGFSISPYTTGALPVSVYYKTGTYVGSETTAANWTLLGTYNLTSPGAGIQTYLDVTDFTIPAGQPTGIYLDYNASYTTMSTITTYSSAELQLTAGAGLCSAFGGVNTPRVFNGKVYYGTGGCVSARVSDTAYVMLFPYDADAVSITEPVNGCSGSPEHVSMRIRNNGSNTISGGLIAKYSINGNTPVAEPVTNSILPGDTLDFTFATTFSAGLTFTNPDSVYNIVAYTELTGDNYHDNDTAFTSVTLAYVPPAPILISDTIPYGGIATLHGISSDSIFWYDVPAGGLPLAIGSNFNTPNLFVTTVYYAEARASGATTTWTFDTGLDGWIASSPCSSPVTWTWSSDGGNGTVFAVDHTTNSSQLLISPAVNVNGASTMDLSYTHRYATEAGWDHGFVAYRLDGGSWVQFVPTVGSYNTSDSQYGEPLWNSCSSSPNMPLYDGTLAYATHSGPINTAGANLLEIAFVFTTDASGGVDGWYLDEVTVDGGVGGCASARVPDTAYVVLMPYEASVVSMPAPVNQCTDGSENVTIRIRNNGSNTINGGLTAKYSVNGSAPVAEPVTNTILPGDTLTFTFATPFTTVLTSVNQDTVCNIMSYIELTGDAYSLNDTLMKSVTLIYTPPSPVLTNITIPYGTSGLLQGIAADSIYWYDMATGGTLLGVGSNFTTPILYGTTVYYAETRTTGATTNWNFDSNLQGWTVQNPCSSASSWAWDADGGNGALFAVDPSSNSSQLIVSPAVSVGGTPSVTLSYDHHYATESCCDEGYVAYRIDGGAWTQFIPSVNAYLGSHNIDNDPLNNCVSSTKDCYYGTQATMITSSGTINTTGATNIELAFVFTSDGSVAGTGWYINAVELEGGTGACPSDRLPDTVFVTGVPACDVNVEAILSPTSGIELTNSEPITVRVKNYGTSPAVNVPIHYVINGGTVINDVVPGPIATNDMALFTFATPADLSAFTTYNLTVYTNLSCDATLVNDTAYETIVNNPLTYCTSIPSYTSDEEIFSVTVNGATNAYDCSTVAPGPGSILNRYSNFMTLPPLTSLGQGASYSFTILEDECDGPTYYSNGCAIWIDYNHDGDYTDAGEQVYVENTTTAGPRTITGTFTVPVGGFSGVTGMRIIVAEGYSGASLQPCMTYGYGETEDYLIRILPQIPHDAGVTAIVQPTSPQNEGVSAPVQVTVRNFGTDPITNASNMLVAYSYNGGAPQSITWAGGTIAPLATANVTLPNITVLPNDLSLCAWTVLAGDSNTFNDTTCMTLHGNPQIDAGIIAFVQPGASLNQGANATVQVTLKNFGVDTLTSMNLVYTLNGVIQATQPWTGTLLPNASTNVTFTQTFVVPMAAFSICAYSSLATDANHANDTLCMSAYGVFTSTLPYYDNFDGATINWLAGPVSNGSLWELGTPNYGTTNSAHSAPKAWDVNLTTAYTNSATTYLYTQNFDFSTAVNARMKFWLNYNVEATYDGLRLEYTTNGGTTWNTLGVLNDVNGVNWYNSASITASGLPGWTNTSSGWKQSEYKLNILNNVPLVRFRFVFNSNASTVASGASVDDFSITIPAPLDAGVEVIHKPVVQTPGGALTNVKVRIRNFGSDTLTSIPVSYRVGLTGIPVVQTWTGTLYPDDTATVNFTSALTPPTGIFDLYSYTGLAGDGDLLNDTAKNRITGVPTYPVPYNDNFEGLVTWFSTGTLWEYGVPAATVINSAYSPTHAWVTNLDGDYTDLATEYLYTPLFMFTGVDSAYLDFYHWYETEASWDGCNVEYSIGGGTWTVLGTTSDVNGLNWYNSTVSNTPSWSGSSSGYIHSRYRLTSVPAIVNAVLPVQFRFKFRSDGGGTDEGWAIDNFAITAPQIPDDAGVSAILLPNAATQTGSQVTVQVTIKNYGTNSLSSIPVRYVINGGAVTSETWSGTLASGATANYTFTTPYTSPGSTYDLCAFTKLTGDVYTFNDTTCASFNTTAAPHDVGVVAIIEPSDTTTYNQADSVKILIKNFGTSPETLIPVVFLRNSVQIGAGNWTGVLNGGATVVYTFNTLNVSPQGNYVLCAKTMLAGDSDPANDDSCSYLYGMTGIATYDYSGFVLYQNVPNPAGNNTSIVFYVPVSDKVRFEMYDVLGKAIRVEDIDAVKGENMIELNAASMSEGIYLYSVSYKGQKQTKRMVVSK